MNAFIMMMCNLACTEHGLNVLLIDSLFTQSLLSQTGLSNGYRTKLASMEILKSDICFLLINVAHIHWSLLVIVPEEKLFIYIDSMH